MWLTRAALAHPIAVTLFYIAIAVAGLVAVFSIGRSVLPPISLPAVSVLATYPSAGAAEMERLVIEPIEDSLDNVAGVDRVSASAQHGVAQIAVRFKYGVSIEKAQNDVQHAVEAARVNFPSDLQPPVVERNDPSIAPVVDLAVSSAVLGRRDLERIVDKQIVPALRGTAGAGSVRAVGTFRRIFLVSPKRKALDAVGITGLDLLRAMQSAGAVYPGGYEEDGPVRTSVSVRADSQSPLQLARIPVMSTNAVTAGEVADIRDAFDDPSTVSSYNGDDAILLYVSRTPGSDTLRTVRSVRNTVVRLRQAYPLVRIAEFRSDLPFTNAAVSGVVQTLFEGILLTVLTMLLFLHSWRNAAIAALAIPCSLFATFVAMWLLGFTINVLSLMGLSMTIGILVDDSIVIIDAIAHARARGTAAVAAALAGRKELGGAAIAITFVDIVVFGPIAVMSGVVGQFMREFAAVIVIATAFSLLVSFTLTPLLSARWTMKERIATRLPWTLRGEWFQAILFCGSAFARSFNALEAQVANFYAIRLLPVAWKYRKLLLAGVGLVALLSFIPLANGGIPMEFSPPVDRGEVTVDLFEPPGTPIQRTNVNLRRVAARLLDDNRVAGVVTTAGRGFDGVSDVLAENLGEISIELRDETSTGSAIASYAKSLGALVPEASFSQTGRGMGGTAPISFTVSGDAAALPVAARNVEAQLRADPFVTDVRRSDVGVAPQLEMRVDSERAKLLAVDAGDASLTARLASGGILATRTRTDDWLIDVVVRDESARNGDSDWNTRLTVRSATGALIPLSDLITQRRTLEPLVLERENRQRIVSITANPLDGMPVETALAPVARRIDSVLPFGTHIEKRGDLEQFEETVSKIVATLALSILLVYSILAVLYRSYRLPLVVMATVPLAAVGAFGTLTALNALHDVFPGAGVFASQTLNLYSMLGIVLLVGLVAKNGILLVEFAEREVRDGIDALQAMQHAAHRRFRPVVMTTCAMIGGMLPLALGDAAGAEFRKALGSVVIGGLTSSLILTFFVVPLVYVMSRGGLKKKRALQMQRPFIPESLEIT